MSGSRLVATLGATSGSSAITASSLVWATAQSIYDVKFAVNGIPYTCSLV